MADNNTYYVVQIGDTLTSIAKKFNTTVTKIVELNNLENPDLIYVGQKLIVSGTAVTKPTTNGKTVTITAFGLQAMSNRNIFVTWAWTEPNTENYRVIWRYQTNDKNNAGENIWFTGTDSTTSNEDTRESVYNAPENAIAVKVKIKPNAKSGSAAGASTSKWTADWSTEQVYYFKNSPPTIPSVPNVKINKYKLTCELSGINSDTTEIEFQVVKDHNGKVFNSGISKVYTGYTSYVCNVEAGSKYKVRCRAKRNTLYSEWTEYSSIVGSLPSAPVLRDINVLSETSAQIVWSKVNSAEGYVIEYAVKDEEIIANTHATKEEYFNISGVSISSITVEVDAEITDENVSRTIVNLSTGAEYYVRIRAANDSAYSNWSNIESFVIGVKPTKPTTWSSTTTAVVGEPLNLFWIHNSSDGSRQVAAKLKIKFDNEEQVYDIPPYEYSDDRINIIRKSDPDNESDKTYICELNTQHESFKDGSKIEWSVCTAGVKIAKIPATCYMYDNVTGETNIYNGVPIEIKSVAVLPDAGLNFEKHGVIYYDRSQDSVFTYVDNAWMNFIDDILGEDLAHPYIVDSMKDVIYDKIYFIRVPEVENGGPDYSDYSTSRIVEIYAPPTLGISLKDLNLSDLNQQLKTFPFYVEATAGNTVNQKPVGYYVTVTANESYITVDELGRTKNVSVGGEVYSKYFDISETSLNVKLSAGDIDLENNITYTVEVTVSMDSGLTASSSQTFKVGWNEETYIPTAEIGIDKKSISAYIRPYCAYPTTEDDDTIRYVPDVLLSVYRREFDGSFTEIVTDLENGKNTFVTDPHPSLDYARYRIVAENQITGAISYNDVPGYPVGEKAIIIQWDEEWQNFETSEEVEMEQQPWTGSMLRLPYNIDVSDSNNPDVSLVEYIGRKYPVGYYGTQIRSSSTWNTEIPKDDKETLYALRRLSVWMGNVYVREPSGSGYWANVKVTWNQKHIVLTIPITLNITRVEGGM